MTYWPRCSKAAHDPGLRFGRMVEASKLGCHAQAKPLAWHRTHHLANLLVTSFVTEYDGLPADPGGSTRSMQQVVTAAFGDAHVRGCVPFMFEATGHQE